MKQLFFILYFLFLFSTISAQDSFVKKVGNDGTVFYVGNGVIEVEGGTKIIVPAGVNVNNVKFESGFFINDTYDARFVVSKTGEVIIPLGKYDIFYGTRRDEIGNIYFNVGKRTKKGYNEGFVDYKGDEIVKLQSEYVSFTSDGFKIGKNYKKAKLTKVSIGKKNGSLSKMQRAYQVNVINLRILVEQNYT